MLRYRLYRKLNSQAKFAIILV